MRKYILALVIFLLFGAAVYYFGLYTYFIRTEVQESLPITSSDTEAMKTLAVGNFTEVDFIHKGSGEAKLINAGGKRILRFENFNVTSGPDLYVYLSKSDNPTGDIKSLSDYIDLGLLKGTSGNQNYEIDQDITGYKTAIVWCKRFGVLFTYAIMK